MNVETSREIRHVAIMIVVAVAVTGYFVGLQSPMNPVTTGTIAPVAGEHPAHDHSNPDTVQPARTYAEMRQLDQGLNGNWGTSLDMLGTGEPDLFASFVVSEAEKTEALKSRSLNRAFNGAPPTVPHPIDQMTAESCAACHQLGARTASLRIPAMSHPWMANCTQCHVEATPAYMMPVTVANNTFSGLPAPHGGPRAFANAPPQIPHSTWMRENCRSCHGTTGQFGIRTAHPWRQNCEQCHTPSTVHEQSLLQPVPEFLPSPKVHK